jgi:hypothetical protein
MPPFFLSRRETLNLVGASSLAALPLPYATTEANAQAAGSERVLRYGISMADIPQTTGQPGPRRRRLPVHRPHPL